MYEFNSFQLQILIELYVSYNIVQQFVSAVLIL